jgi:predicted DNA-binding transcriptional regulator AlpA
MTEDEIEKLAATIAKTTVEHLKFTLWTATATPAPIIPPTPSTALDIADVMQRTGMSRGWLYREARAGHLPFARRIGRRLVFDDAGLTRWLEKRRTR